MCRPAFAFPLPTAAVLTAAGGFAVGAGGVVGPADVTALVIGAAGAAVLVAGFALAVAGHRRAVAGVTALRDRLAGQEAAAGRLAGVQDALRASEARLADTQRIARIGRWEWDSGTNTVWVSPELSRLYERPAADRRLTVDEVMGWVHADDRDAVRLAGRTALAGGATTDAVARFVTPAGEVRWFRSTFHPGPGGAGGVGFTGVTQDVTDELRGREERHQFAANLQQTQRLEALGVLTGGVAHDFNNLLTGILGNATLAREAVPADSPLLEFLRPIELSADQAAHLCRQMLTYAGRAGAAFKPVDLNRTVRESDVLLRLAAGKRVTLRAELAASPPAADGDAGRLRQVMINLVQNAAEAIGHRPGTVTVRTGAGGNDLPGGRWFGGPPPADAVWVEVADTGCGMDDDTRDRVFEPFFTTKVTGRGLGLAAVHGIVREHGGVIGVTSELGRGTTFRVALPAVADQDTLSDVSAVADTRPPAGPAEGPAADGPPAGGRAPRVALVADDEPTIRGLAGVVLRALGFEVVEAATGHEAVAAVRAAPGRFTLALLDVLMPELDGRAALTDLRILRPDLPVVLMSGYSEDDLRDLKLGPTLHFLQKPFRPADLTACVRQALPHAAA